jgi:hypothetical protein
MRGVERWPCREERADGQCGERVEDALDGPRLFAVAGALEARQSLRML